MDRKKIFRNDKAVSPVIGVVLMVAITVILAAAIGSSVFGQGPAKSAPQANINVKFSNYVSGVPENITIEHLGGDSINWDNAELRLYDINGSTVGVNTTSIQTDYFNVGDVESLGINGTDVIELNSIYNVKIVDLLSNQVICNKELRT
ncbi:MULTISPECIES: type IV pilin [unclassified Methanosarcina]|uniref:type IV pilin n=1 Tax=unclassified Methanosarcina TaxID=2644672 RepID=UPI0006159601|nr:MULTISPECIES: type IV pilin [unclassified Methanosarcina]AKB17020.1 hypothetical protein MSWHS_0157 [Methanosarcina sp. WWM596]AKB20429.1 hypothetical protein MSWH1_0158 [Methanosarcina sp. WH1]